MFKLLFKYVIPLVLLLTAGVVGYNYFFGTPAEQEKSKQIIAKVKGLGTDIYNLLASETDKFEDGKYNNAIDKIGSSLSYLKDQIATLADEGSQFLDQLKALEAEKEQLEQELVRLNEESNAASQFTAEGPANAGRSSSSTQPAAEEIQNRINELARKTEELALRMGGS